MNTKLDKILAEISAGELIDKITILEIKKVRIVNKDKLIEIEKELLSLNETVKKFIPDHSKISKFKDNLKEINLKLWDIEDGKRSAEKNKEFGDLSTNIAFIISKQDDLSTMDVASKIAKGLKASNIFREINVAEPGFINFKINII